MATSYKIIGADGAEYGPTTLEELREWIEDGRVGQATLVWKNDERRWLAAGMRDELRWDLPAPPPLSTSVGALSRAGDLEPEISRDSVRPAGFWIRLVAYFFDLTFLILLLNVVLMPWHDWMSDVRRQITAMNPNEISQDAEKLIQFYKLILPPLFLQFGAYSLLSLAYYVGFNGSQGATPGKFMTGLRVESADGLPLGYRQAFIRFSAELLSWLVLGLGYIMIAHDPAKRALHDRLTKTRVVHRV